MKKYSFIGNSWKDRFIKLILMVNNVSAKICYKCPYFNDKHLPRVALTNSCIISQTLWPVFINVL